MTCPYASEDLGKFTTLRGCRLIVSRMGVNGKKQFWGCPNRVNEALYEDCFFFKKQQALESKKESL